jgi:hypothetical protein
LLYVTRDIYTARESVHMYSTLLTFFLHSRGHTDGSAEILLHNKMGCRQQGRIPSFAQKKTCDNCCFIVFTCQPAHNGGASLFLGYLCLNSRRSSLTEYKHQRWGSAKKFRKLKMRQFADLNNLLDLRTFPKCVNLRICELRICNLRTQAFLRT